MANLVLVTGSSDLSSTASYDAGALPADGDSVYYRNSTTNITAGLNQSAIEPALVEVERSMSGLFPATGTFEMGPAILNIGRLNGIQNITQAGSARIVWDSAGDICALTVYHTATTTQNTGYEPFRWKGTNAGNTLVVHEGTVGIATNDPDDTATVATFFLWGGTTRFASGCTLTTGTLIDGTVFINSAITTFTQEGGTATIDGSGAITTDNIRAGTQNHKSTGTITTCNLFKGATLNKWSGAATIATLNIGGKLDLSEATGTITVTNMVQTSDDAEIYDPRGLLVMSNAATQTSGVRRNIKYTGDGGSTMLYVA